MTAPSSGHGDDTEINKALPFKITGLLRQERQQVSVAEEGEAAVSLEG